MPAIPHPRRRRLLAGLTSLTLAVGAMIAVDVSAPAIASAAEGCDVQFAVQTSDNGFTHPGIGLTAPILQNARDQIRQGADPWAGYFTQMKNSSAAAIDVKSSNASADDATKIDQDAFNSQGLNSRFISDALKAYTQALLYSLTGEQAYRTNAMAIIRIWEQVDPAKYQVFTDSHIHTGIPLQRMATAAELLRYGSCSSDVAPWTDSDTERFTTNLVRPVIETFQHDQNHFMNQHNYPLLGAMAGYIFMNDRDRYNEAIEWYTVNATATNQGFNGSISQLFRMVDRDDATGQAISDPHVQHVEMGRDQAHGGGDITNAYILARMVMAQGTKIDPVTGKPSTDANAVGPYEFLNDRILAAADYFWKFMLGYDTEWTPVAYSIAPDGTILDTYDHISNQYRGRFNTASFWDLYYYYTYVKGEDLTVKAPHLAEAFSKRLPLEYYYQGAVTRAWDSADGGGDFWLFTPAAAKGTDVPKLQTSGTVIQAEDRFTAISGKSEKGTDNGVGYVRLNSVDGGTRIAVLNASSKQKRFGLRVRATDTVKLHLSFGMTKDIVVPATAGGWRTIVVDLAPSESLGDMIYIESDGPGTLDVDSLLVDQTTLNPLTFDKAPDRVVALTGTTTSVSLAVDTPRAGLSYTAAELPAGASLDPSTGALSWTPTDANESDVVVTVSDGDVIAAHTVHLASAATTDSVLTLAQTGFDAQVAYETPTRTAFDATLKAATDSAPGDAFTVAANKVVAAVKALRLLSPQTPTAGLDYPGLLTASTAGDSTGLLIDQDNQSGTTYGQAVGLAHVFNFGPFHRVSASAFELQSNIFEDRLANSAVFGSNDGTTWTRLTPDVTTMTQNLQRLEVAPELRDARFQYIKVQLLKALPDVLYGTIQNLFEITEFHIIGQRFETTGSIDQVSIASPTSLKGRVVTGDTVTLSFHSPTPIRDVVVTIGGASATTTTSDNLTWTATTTLTAGTPVGAKLPFTIDHTTQDGTRADQLVGTSDGTSLYSSSNDGLVDSTFASSKVLAQDGSVSASLAKDAANLFDGKAETHTDTRMVGSKAALEWDLGEGGSVTIGGVDVLVRQDQYGTSRLSNLRFEGSNDNSTWVPLTSTVAATPDWQRLTSTSTDAYRYIRLVNGNIINLAETRIFGTYTAPVSNITAVTLTSSNAMPTYAVDGDTVTLNVTLSDQPQSISATIDGAPVTLTQVGRAAASYQAKAAVAVKGRIGKLVPISIDHTTADGRKAVTTTVTSDGSSVWMGTNDSLITGLMDISKPVTPTGQPDTSTLAKPGSLFDSNLQTATDARVVNGTADIVLDLGAGRLTLTRLEMALRQDDVGVSRVNGMALQGSTDLASWTTLATGVQATTAWQGFTVGSPAASTPFRYLRLTNKTFLNVAELRLYGAVSAATPSPSPSPSFTPSPSISPSPSPSPTDTPSPSISPSPSPSPTDTPSPSISPSPSPSPTVTPEQPPSPSPSATTSASADPSTSPSASTMPDPQESDGPTAEATATVTPTGSGSDGASSDPSSGPSLPGTGGPSVLPTLVGFLLLLGGGVLVAARRRHG